MPKKDLKLGFVIGGAVGILIQSMLTTIGGSVPWIGDEPTLILRFGIFGFFLLLAPAALAIAHVLGRFLPIIYQFAKYAAVGTMNSFIDFGILNLLIALTGMPAGVPFRVFKGISFLCATTNSFFWNKLWTFGAKESDAKKEAPRFYLIAALGWVLNVAVASFIVDGVPRPDSISPELWANVGALVGIFATLLWNFLGYKFFVFRKRA